MASETSAVHPVAAMFPMMSDEELDDLAADIAANGLHDPIMYDAEGTLIDGRNRLAACQRLGWIDFPTTTLPAGQDPVAYILSKNVTRRHLSKGQAAMAVARALLVSNTSQSSAAKAAGLNRTRVVQASVVLSYAPELADAVLAGALSLDAAYETARQRKQATEAREQEEANARAEQERAAKEAQRTLTKLQREAPEFADLVTEGTMTVSQAMAAFKQKQEEEQSHKRAISQNLATALVNLDPMRVGVEATARTFLKADPQLAGYPADAFSAARIRNVIAVLNAWLEMIEGDPNGKQSQAA